jgi:superfamily II DNA or RNA helicase
MTQGTFSPGALVRLKSNPGRSGTVTDKPPRDRGDHKAYQVRFPEGPNYVPDYDLEGVNETSSDPYELLYAGRYGGVQDLRRNLTHIQLTGKLANLVYSMDTTNTEFHPYQFKPVLAFLDSPSRGMLIADEVGLGKTIEAGLIWTELRARYDARRLLVVCPAMLCQKWKFELASKFSIDAEIMDSAGLLSELDINRGSVRDGRAIICSMQGLRPPANWDDADQAKGPAAQLARLLDAESGNEPLIDMVIVDESHYLRNPETRTAELGQLLRGVTDHIVLLSATPVNLHEEDLFHQLNLVDPDFFTHQDSFPQVLRANEPLVRARDAVLDVRSSAEEVLDFLREAQRHELLETSGQLQDLVNGGVTSELMSTNAGRIRLADRIERINLLAHAVSRTRKIDVHELKVVREPHAYFVRMTEEERSVYELVTEAILRYAATADINSAFLLASPQRQVSSSLYAAIRSWRSRSAPIGEQIYEDFGVDDVEDSGVGPILSRLIEDVLPHVDASALRSRDSKFETLRGLLSDYIGKHPNEKVVVFSYYPGTLTYLEERLREEGIQGLVLHGSIGRPKQEVISEFRTDPAIRVLLSSEVASEGVDLQFCRVLVNYDLPWNPMKVEQRIGRLDRLGQKADKISIINLGHAETIDHRIYTRLMERLQIFTRALGGLEGILGGVIQDLTTDLLSQRLTPAQQEDRIQRSALAVEKVRQQQDELEKQASHMIAHGGYILEQVRAAHEFKKRITSEDLEIYVRDYLNKYARGFQFQKVRPDELLFDIRLSPDLAASLQEFVRQKRLTGITRLANGDVVRCRFLNKLVPPDQREEVISQFHPIIRFISEDLRVRNEAFYPLVAMAIPAGASNVPVEPGHYAFVVHRWQFEGLRPEEHLQCRVARLQSTVLLEPNSSFDVVNHARVSGEDWLAAPNQLEPGAVEAAVEACLAQLAADLESAAREKDLDNRDRVNFQMMAAKRHRDRQLEIQRGILQTLQQRGSTRLVPATEGRIRRIRDRFDMRESELRQKLELRWNPFEVCFGVIRVH